MLRVALYKARTSDPSVDGFIPALPEPLFNCLVFSSPFLLMNEHGLEVEVSICTAGDAKYLKR